MYLQRQPFKSLYLTYEIFVTVLVLLPIWALLAVPRSWRPRSKWTIKRCIMVKLTRRLMKIFQKAGPLRKVYNALALDTDPKVQGVWINPVPELITGKLSIWAAAASVQPVRIPGYWQHEKESPVLLNAPYIPGEKVVYFFHGGAYMTLSAHPSNPTAGIERRILEYVPSVRRTFSLEFRLSSGPPQPSANPFPAALIDALAGYNYLVKVIGIPPEKIIIAGDSSGANLALALVRYLIEYAGHLDGAIPAIPGGLVLLSAWADVSEAHYGSNPLYIANSQADILVVGEGSLLRWAASVFTGSLGIAAAATNEYISPASPESSADFKGFPRTILTAGGTEVLLPQLRTLKDRMEKGIGERLTYLEMPDAIHDYMLFPWHQPEIGQTMKAIASFVEGLGYVAYLIAFKLQVQLRDRCMCQCAKA